MEKGHSMRKNRGRENQRRAVDKTHKKGMGEEEDGKAGP